MALSAALKAALRSSSPRAVHLCEIDSPEGTTLRYSMRGYSSVGTGHYDGRVTDYGKIRRVLSPRGQGTLQSVKTFVELEDTDRAWAKLSEGEFADDIENSAIRIKLAHPEVAEADWLTRFAGIVDVWEWTGPMRVAVSAVGDDRPLIRKYPRGAWVINNVDWPNVPSDSIGQVTPLLYGKHDSALLSNTGMVPTIYVDNSGFRYMVCAGRAADVSRVLKDGVPVGAGFTITNPIIRGKLYTLVDFAGDQGDSSIDVDVDGYENVGDGTGVWISNPADQLTHYLSNFVFGDYRSGNWLSDSSLVDSTTFATLASYFTNHSIEGSRRLSSQQKAKDVIAEWLQSLEARGWWTTEGTIAAGVEDPTIIDIYQDDPWIRWERDLNGPFRMVPDNHEQVTALTLNYAFSEADGSFAATTDVMRPSVENRFPDTLDLPWSAAH